MTNPKYTLYVWSTNDEGGYAICPFGEFSPKRNNEPNAMPSERIGDFSTTSELADLLYADDPDWFVDKVIALYDATEMMEKYKGSEGK